MFSTLQGHPLGILCTLHPREETDGEGYNLELNLRIDNRGCRYYILCISSRICRCPWILTMIIDGI